MKTILTISIIIAFHIVVYADDLTITSTTTTNLTAQAWRRTEIYTRNGKRILQTEKTSAIDGSVWTLEQNIIWQDQVAVNFSTVNSLRTGTSRDIRLYANQGVDAVASWDEAGTLRMWLKEPNDEIRLGFVVVEGVLKPISTKEVDRSNAIIQGMQQTFERFIKKESTGDQFLGEIQDLQETTQND